MKRRLLQRRVTLRNADGEGPVAAGYAAVFYREGDPGTEYVVGRVRERIAPGAFDRALADKQEVVAKYNHDSNQVLGRTSNGHLRLSVDDVGLAYEIDLPDTQVGRDLVVSLERGDVVGSSFAFDIAPGGITRDFSDGDVTITLTDLDLGDVGPVANPAYTSTDAALRNDEDWQKHQRDAAEFERDRRIRRVRGLDVLEDLVKNS